MNKNNTIIGFGLLLIAIIGVITFYRSFLFDAKEKEYQTSQKIEAAEKYESVSKTEPQALSEKMRQDDSLLIIDLRSISDFETEHIADSQNLIFDELATLDKTRKYVLLDEGGDSNHAANAVITMEKSGFESVSLLSGGFQAWKTNGLPTVSIGNPDSFIDQAKVNYISPNEAKQVLESEDKNSLFIVDVRNEASFSEEHIVTARNIPLTQIENRRREFPMGKIVILYANDNIESFQAAVRLFDLGFFNTKILMGGINEWKNKGFAVESNLQ